MKKLNKKGFTLIELLAVIIIMGVLLLVAVPAVQKTIQQSRIRTYKNNLAKFVDAVSLEVNSYDNPDYQFSNTEVLVAPLVCIELESGSNTKSPFSTYNKKESYVVVYRTNNGDFRYKVAALDGAGFGTKLSTAEDVNVHLFNSTQGAGDKIIPITGTAGAYSIDVSSLGLTDKSSATTSAKVVGNCNLE